MVRIWVSGRMRDDHPGRLRRQAGGGRLSSPPRFQNVGVSVRPRTVTASSRSAASPPAAAVLSALRPVLTGHTAFSNPQAIVLDTVVTLVPAVTGATLSRRHRGSATPRTVAATHPALEAIGNAQVHAGQGPVVDAIKHNAMVLTDDLTSDPRWPSLHRRLTGAAPLAATSVPIRDGHHRLTALTLYSRAPLTSADHDQIPVIVGILELALITLVQHERVVHLEHATTSNRRIGVALGVLVAHHRTTTEQAFETLAEASQALNVKLVDLADEVILTGTIPDHDNPGLTLPAPRRATP